MAASRGAVWLSGATRSCWGAFPGLIYRRTPCPRSPIAENAKSMHTTSALHAAPKNKDPAYRTSVYFKGGASSDNAMKKIGWAWAIGFPSGILLFLYAKNTVDKQRIEQMKARQRMRDANKGEYVSERFSKSV
ncbi:hypothetical protein GDO78_003991 [Eleutherodactylus coqui]|uniref:Uncharacterized protein n=1 Tax=Eleutherodactylus coqui TaxID=57060 RepID=A0A8J6EWC5_ELECQ|nr:hypothetical protein GDO78_003991 [Eleutherodactylus coqui]